VAGKLEESFLFASGMSSANTKLVPSLGLRTVGGGLAITEIKMRTH
jgi:hypothetical protein